MRELSIDIETYSSANLLKTGAYAYADAPDFTILLLSYAFDEDSVQIIDLASNEELPDKLLQALNNTDIRKSAYNANFERTCIAKYLGIPMPPEQWTCSMVHASELGLPRSLAKVAEALGLQEQKDKAGKALIDYFSKPCKPTKTNGGRTRNLPRHAPEKWEKFKSYCVQDVVVEREIKRKLSRFPLVKCEQRLWEYDQRITDRGVNVDVAFAKNAIAFNKIFADECITKMQQLTGVSNPKSVAQLKNWLYKETGQEYSSLDKKSVKTILLAENINPKVEAVLRLRGGIAKTSTKKYEAMVQDVCKDGKLRGILQFYGANRTGRWAGRLVQVQNLPQNHLKDLALARQCVADGDYALFEMLFGNTPGVLSELIRTAFIPSEGRRFIVSDFSAIEARVIAYLAGERWRLDVFKAGGDIYCASASQMFKVPVVKHGVNGHLRQKGKIAELALGYGGSVGALKSMGALEMGLEEDELQPLVNTWREANPHIKALWKETEKAAINAINGKPTKLNCGILFYKQSGILFARLPSGRSIAYVKPQLKENKFGRMAVTYMGVNQTKNTWERVETFGGKLVENIVQAFARDCLAESIMRLEDRGFEINFHVHDEVILDVPVGASSAEEVAKLMGEPISWAPGLLLKAEAYETDFYKKD